MKWLLLCLLLSLPACTDTPANPKGKCVPVTIGSTMVIGYRCQQDAPSK